MLIAYHNPTVLTVRMYMHSAYTFAQWELSPVVRATFTSRSWTAYLEEISSRYAVFEISHIQCVLFQSKSTVVFISDNTILNSDLAEISSRSVPWNLSTVCVCCTMQCTVQLIELHCALRVRVKRIQKVQHHFLRASKTNSTSLFTFYIKIAHKPFFNRIPYTSQGIPSKVHFLRKYTLAWEPLTSDSGDCTFS